ncbi:LPXTG-site transpeptidase (sortase) family protein [Micrococcales bacterium KH10]|nr:LPXTG-site transpeptidase (sortase) family protein [Micrococcales bacterium KH10]
MTSVTQPPVPSGSTAQVGRALAPAHRTALPRPEQSDRVRSTGDVLQIVGLLIISLIAYTLLVSPLFHMRAQHIAYNELRYQLANGISPVGHVTMSDTPVTTGTPLGVITIEKLGVNEVFLSGTTAQVLQSGPGHRRDSVLPGQSGASVIMGRHASFGGPFGKLDMLTAGDSVTTITGQGQATYRVTGIRRSGDPLPAVMSPGDGRLTLVSATGRSFMPSDVIRVDMELISDPFETPRAVVSAVELDDAEAAFASDSAAWPWVVIWLASWFAVFVLIRRLSWWWGRPQAWIVGVPAFALTTCLLGGAIMQVVPNLV